MPAEIALEFIGVKPAALPQVSGMRYAGQLWARSGIQIRHDPI